MPPRQSVAEPMLTAPEGQTTPKGTHPHIEANLMNPPETRPTVQSEVTAYQNSHIVASGLFRGPRMSHQPSARARSMRTHAIGRRAQHACGHASARQTRTRDYTHDGLSLRLATSCTGPCLAAHVNRSALERRPRSVSL